MSREYCYAACDMGLRMDKRTPYFGFDHKAAARALFDNTTAKRAVICKAFREGPEDKWKLMHTDIRWADRDRID